MFGCEKSLHYFCTRFRERTGLGPGSSSVKREFNEWNYINEKSKGKYVCVFLPFLLLGFGLWIYGYCSTVNTCCIWYAFYVCSFYRFRRMWYAVSMCN